VFSQAVSFCITRCARVVWPRVMLLFYDWALTEPFQQGRSPACAGERSTDEDVRTNDDLARNLGGFGGNACALSVEARLLFVCLFLFCGLWAVTPQQLVAVVSGRKHLLCCATWPCASSMVCSRGTALSMHHGDGRAAGRLGLGEGKKYLQLEGILGRAWRSGSSKYGREAWLLSVVGRDSSERGMNLTRLTTLMNL
jgi:hypothetical protein